MNPPLHGDGHDGPAYLAVADGDLRFRHLLELLPAGAYTCDAEGLITYYNPRAEVLWGRAPRLNDPVDRFCGSFRLFTPDGAPIAHDACWMALALRDERAYNGHEIVVERPDGERLMALAHANPIHDAAGRLLGAVNVLVDITAQKAAAQALEVQVARRTRALVAHRARLRTLALRLGAAEQQERARVAAELHGNLAQLLAVCRVKLGVVRADVPALADHADVATLSHTLADALRYTRTLISELTPPLDYGRDDVGDALRWVAETMRRHGLDVAVSDDGAPKPMDAAACATVAASTRELLFNVLRHSGARAARVDVRRDDGRLHVVVADDGTGFDASVPGERPDSGFGLFSVRERLAALGGHLDLRTAPGAGTRVTLSVPFLRPDPVDGPDAAASPETPADGPALPPIRVLLVEDHAIMREGLRALIEREDDMVVVAEATDGEMAVALAREHGPDLIVMDVGLPKKNGIEATREIVAARPDTAVIALSMNETADAVAAMKRAGVREYLFKSEAFETLCATIRTHGAPQAGTRA